MKQIKLPPGYRFSPTDQQLIQFYLGKKVNEEAPPCNVIKHINLYGEKEPWAIFDEDDDDFDDERDVRYFFTTLKKTGTGKRVLRTAGIGTWTGQDKGKEIYDDQNEVIGFKKHFAFTLGKTNKSSSPSSSSADSWIMHEFSLCASDPKKVRIT
ncbi:NAC domain [Macleaya cordata]|uniref:NAC domain n=1 Tax=Macleaya cordata TaxID=56857 RepID=A0A200PWA9_MACCD|nr:NAC domain [Macleaya cordata]